MKNNSPQLAEMKHCASLSIFVWETQPKVRIYIPISGLSRQVIGVMEEMKLEFDDQEVQRKS